MSRLLLNTPLVLEGRESAPDGAGGRSAAVWTPLGTLWGHVQFGSGRRIERGGASTARTPVTITLRARPVGAADRPVPGQRLRHASRSFRVLAVAERDPLGRLLRCFCEEEVLS